MLKKLKTRKNILLISVSFFTLFAAGFCSSEESLQPETKSLQPETKSLQSAITSLKPETTNIVPGNTFNSESNMQQAGENNHHQEQIVPLVKKPYSFLSRQKDPDNGSKAMSEPTDALTVSLGLMFILLLIFSLAWLMRKTGYAQLSGQGTLSIIATLNLGQKEKIALIKVGQQQILVGITATQINTLSVLDEPLDVGVSDTKTDQSTIVKNNFAKKLSEFLNPSSPVVKKS